MWVAFANAKGTHIFSAKLLAIFNDQSFNNMLTNNIVIVLNNWAQNVKSWQITLYIQALICELIHFQGRLLY